MRAMPLRCSMVWAGGAILAGIVLAAPVGGQQPRHGGTAVVVIDTDPPTLNTALTTGTTDSQVGGPLHAQLLLVDRELQIRPYVAESWTVSPDGMTYTFRLKRTVKFHDDKPLTSADVRFTFEEVLAKYHPRARAAFEYVSSIEAPDPYTIVIRLKKPYAPFLHVMGVDGTILPKHLYEGTDILKNPYNLRPVGAGPFKFQEWLRGDRVVVVRNSDYFEKGQPYLDKIIFKVIPDVSARTIALETGEVDFVYTYYFAKEDYTRVARNPRLITKRDADFPEQDLLIFNVRRPPLAERKVRQAITHAIDRHLILERVYLGVGLVGRSAIDSRLTWAYNPQIDYEKLYAHNPGTANTLLDEAGFRRKPDGSRFTLRLTFDVRRPALLRSAEVIREQLRNVGIPVQLEGVERSVFLDKVFMNWDFDMTLASYSTLGDPAIGVQRLYVCKDVRKAPFVNASGYCNREVDELFEKAASLTTQAARSEPYKKVQVILAQDIPSLPLIDIGKLDVASARMRGLWQAGRAYVFWAPVWVTGD